MYLDRGVGSNQNMGGQTVNRKYSTDDNLIFYSYGLLKMARANAHLDNQDPKTPVF